MNSEIMNVKIFPLILMVLFVNNVTANSDEDYVDAVINLLLNGGSFEVMQSEEDGKEEELVLIGGKWKCGNCAGVDDTMLVYSEVNDLDAEVSDAPVDVQISLSIPSMQCIAVVGERPGLVRRVTGACAGPSVTLSVAAASHFTVNVYAH